MSGVLPVPTGQANNPHCRAFPDIQPNLLLVYLLPPTLTYPSLGQPRPFFLLGCLLLVELASGSVPYPTLTLMHLLSTARHRMLILARHMIWRAYCTRSCAWLAREKRRGPEGPGAKRSPTTYQPDCAMAGEPERVMPSLRHFKADPQPLSMGRTSSAFMEIS